MPLTPAPNVRPKHRPVKLARAIRLRSSAVRLDSNTRVKPVAEDIGIAWRLASLTRRCTAKPGLPCRVRRKCEPGIAFSSQALLSLTSVTSDKITVPYVRAAKVQGKKLAVLTAYDATFARLFDQAGADILLVGDSLGMVVQGLPNTLPVTVDDIIYHTRAVARGTRRAQVVADMPFLSFQASAADAVRNAGRLLKEGGAEAVKLEGGIQCAEAIHRTVRAGIPVMGHIGLLPQSVHAMGGFKVQGRAAAARRQLLEDARALEDAGVYAIVVEGVPTDVGEELTRATSVPTIGIGAGPGCDGQVLVCYDFLGLFSEFTPKFVKRYAELGAAIDEATRRYVAEVQGGDFPGPAHSFAARSSVPSEETGAGALMDEPPQTYGPANDED